MGKQAQEFVDRVGIGILPLLLPGPPHRPLDQVLLGLGAFLCAGVGLGHLGEDCRHGGQLFVRLDDVRERIEADCCVFLEIQVDRSQDIGNLLVGAADVDHPDKRTAGVVVENDVIDQERLAGAGRGRAKDIEIDRSLIVEIQRDELALSADEKQPRRAGAGKISLYRQERQHRGHRGDEVSLHQLDIPPPGMETKRQGGEEKHLSKNRFLLHYIALIFPEPQGTGAGFVSLFRVVAPDQQLRDDPDKLAAVLQVVHGFKKLVLLLVEFR